MKLKALAVVAVAIATLSTTTAATTATTITPESKPEILDSGCSLGGLSKGVNDDKTRAWVDASVLCSLLGVKVLDVPLHIEVHGADCKMPTADASPVSVRHMEIEAKTDCSARADFTVSQTANVEFNVAGVAGVKGQAKQGFKGNSIAAFSKTSHKLAVSLDLLPQTEQEVFGTGGLRFTYDQAVDEAGKARPREGEGMEVEYNTEEENGIG